MSRVYDEKEKAVSVVSHFKDFNGDVVEWKNAFYELWRLQMTWSYAYKIEVTESRKDGVFVYVLAKEAYKNNLIASMETLGFGNIQTYDSYVGIVDGFKHDELDKIDELVID